MSQIVFRADCFTWESEPRGTSLQFLMLRASFLHHENNMQSVGPNLIGPEASGDWWGGGGAKRGGAGEGWARGGVA